MRVKEYLKTINGITRKAQAEIRVIASKALKREETQLESLGAKITSYFKTNQAKLQEQRRRGTVDDTWSQFIYDTRAAAIMDIEKDMMSSILTIRGMAMEATTAVQHFASQHVEWRETAGAEQAQSIRKGTKHLIKTLTVLSRFTSASAMQKQIDFPEDLEPDMMTVHALEKFLRHANTVKLNINDAISKVESVYTPPTAQEVRAAGGPRDNVAAILNSKNARTYIADINRIIKPAKVAIESLISWAFETREIHRMIKAINDIIKIIRGTLTKINEFINGYGQIDFIGTGFSGEALRQRVKSLLKVLQSIASIELKDGNKVKLPRHLQLNKDDVTETWIGEVNFVIGNDNSRNFKRMLGYFRRMNLTLTAMKSGRQVLNKAAREILERRRREQAKKRKDREAGPSSQRPSNKPKKTALHLKF